MNGGSGVGGDFDAPKRVAYVNALFVIGTLGTLITPAMLEAWSGLHWTQGQQGVVAGIELATMAAGSLTGLYWQRRWNWRRVTMASLAIGVAANLACLVFDDYGSVCVCRGLAGLAGGFLCAIYSAFVANARGPGRIIAVTTLIQTGVESVFIFSTTSIFGLLGSTGLFMLMAALFLMLIPFGSSLPAGWPADESNAPSNDVQSTRGYWLLLAFLPFVVVQSGTFTFLGEFGRMSAHLDVAASLHAIGVSVVLGSLGSIAAYFLSDRVGLWLPIAASIALVIVSLLGIVLGSRTAVLFLLYVSLLQIAMIFLNCYLYSALIEANNILVPAAMPLAGFGAGLGASAMGHAFEQRGPVGGLGLGISCALLTALLTLPFLPRLNPKQTRCAPTSM